MKRRDAPDSTEPAVYGRSSSPQPQQPVQFQDIVHDLVFRLGSKYPYAVVVHLIALDNGRRDSKAARDDLKERAAQSLLSR